MLCLDAMVQLSTSGVLVQHAGFTDIPRSSIVVLMRVLKNKRESCFPLGYVIVTSRPERGWKKKVCVKTGPRAENDMQLLPLLISAIMPCSKRI